MLASWATAVMPCSFVERRPIGLGYASVSLVVGEGKLAKGRTERDHWTHRRVTHTHKEQRAEGGRLVVG